MMTKRQRQLVVYDGNAQVDHVSSLRPDFRLIPASPETLLQLIASQLIHGVILHYPVLTREQMTSIDQFKAYTAWLPVIVLSDHWNLDAARQCGQIGIDALIACAEKPEKKLAAITAALRAGGFRKLLAEAGRPLTAWPLRMKNAYELILTNFPKVLHVADLSTSLGIQRRSFEREFCQTFGLSYVHLVRILRLYEGWHLMQYTDMDNSEIADYLNYHEEAHFARDCRKLFHLKPNVLRELSENAFRDLVKKCFLPEK